MKNATIFNRSLCVYIILIFTFVLFYVTEANGQNQRRNRPPLTPTLGLDLGIMELDTPEFTLKLVKASQTIAALEPKSAEGFYFTPRRPARNAGRQYVLSSGRYQPSNSVRQRNYLDRAVNRG